MYNLSSWRSHLGIALVNLLHQARENREGRIYSLSSWRCHPGIEYEQCDPFVSEEDI